MKIIVIGFVLIISSFFIILLMGCCNMKNINDVALAYMEKKYGEKFEYGAPYGNSMSGTHQLLVKCATFPDRYILVKIENYRHRKKIFLDNYLAVKYREDTIEFISDCANQVFEESNVFYNVSNGALSPDLSLTATFSEFLADTRVPLHILVEVKASNFISEEQAQNLTELVAASGANFFLTLIFVDDKEYGTFNRDTLYKHVELNKFGRGAFVSKFGDDIEIRWIVR